MKPSVALPLPSAVQALCRASTAALQEPNVIARFETMGLVRPVGTPKEFAASLKEQADDWRTTTERGKTAR
jgi:tripartite-type tricarboxylate transporter receptor subunit TctC